MRFKWISADDPEYEKERLLRWEVLAKPQGVPPGPENAADEMQCMHLIALEGKEIVGCICFHPESVHNGRIFEMAISEEYRGEGFGRKLLHALEEKLRERGIRNVYLYVKPESEDFYSLMGYRFEGETINQMGFEHKKMHKNLPTHES